MQWDDIEAIIFKTLVSETKSRGQWVSLNALLRKAGVEEAADIIGGMKGLATKKWVQFDPPVGALFSADEFRATPNSVKYLAHPKTTLDNTPIQARFTGEGITERDRRILAEHQGQLAIKQNLSFDEVMNFTRDSVQAAKDSAAAAKVSAEQGSRANSRAAISNYVAMVSALAAIAAVVWPMFNAPIPKQDRLIVLPLLYTPRDSRSDATPSSRPSQADSLEAAKTDSLPADSVKR